MSFLSGVILCLRGALVGFGAILPGISGGALCAAFGMYKPIMELLAHPIKTLKKDWLRLLLFVIGVGIGFVGLAGLTGDLMEKYEQEMTCLFVGFVLGTVPGLWRDAGKTGRSKSSYASLGIAFVVLTAILLTVRIVSGGVQLAQDFWGFLLCGVLWGLSMIVPGLSSSTLILFFGLYEAMLLGIKTLSFGVLLPLGLGIVACILVFPKAVNAALDKWPSQIGHAIVGVVLASTIVVVPEGIFASAGALLVGLAYIVVGFVFSFIGDKWCAKLEERSGGR